MPAVNLFFSVPLCCYIETMTLRMYGSLQGRMEQLGKHELKSPISVNELLRTIGLPGSEVKMAMINNRPAHPESMIEPSDSVALFPREYPFFADWKDFRWNRKE